MFQYLPAMERVAFQPHSTLAGKTVALCAEFLDWVEATRQSRLVDGKLPPVTQGRILAALKYGKETFTPALTKILANELHLNASIICTGDPIANGVMFWAFRNISTEQSRTIQTHYHGLSSYTKDPVDLTLFDNLDTHIDLSKSAFDKIPNDYVMILGIFTSLFLGTEVFGNMAPLTAEELAAVILHECGHAVSIFEHFGDLYHRADLVGNSVRYISETADAKTVFSTADGIKKAETATPDTDLAKSFDEIMARIEETKEKASGLHPIAVVALAPVIAVVASLLLWHFYASFSAAYQRLVTAGRYGVINEGYHKTSDTVVSESNTGYDERIADEFVSRHGLGAALAAGLKKLESPSQYVRDEVTDAMYKHRVMCKVLGGINAVAHYLSMLWFVDDGTYDPLWLRIEHILRNNMVIFKDESLSDELRTHFLKETADLLQTVAELKSNKGYKISQLFWGTIMRILSRGSILDGLRTAGLSADYDILQRLTGGLVKNSLYYHAARLKSL